MLTRREFAVFTSCVICGITEFVAAQASAQGTPPAATAGVTRKILSQTDGPTPGYVTLLVEATIEAGVAVGRHTHPGIESAFVLEGGFELPVQGQPTRTLKAGDGFQIPPATPHAGGKAGDARSRILITYVVEKGKPLASPAA
jgi:quercetin dioxygenase-like cupin family protein